MIATVLVAAAAAPAAPPTLAPLTVVVNPDERSVAANWSLPPNMHGYLVEASRTPYTYATGDLKGQFLTEDVVAWSLVFLSNTTTFKFNAGPGTVWVHLAAYDETACESPYSPTCVKEFSNMESAEIRTGSPPGMISVGHNSRRLTAEWFRSLWHESVFIEAATSPEVYTSGEAAGLFLDENRMLFDPSLSPNQVKYTSSVPFPPGTYYVHVGTSDVSGCCLWEIAPPLSVTIPPNPPVLRAVKHEDGILHADWSLPPDMHNDFVEVATSPDVYSDGPLAGLFLDENLVLYDDLLGPTQTSWDAEGPLPDGVYYLHVGGLALGACPTFDAPTCVDELSKVLPVRIGVPSSAPAASSAAAPAPDTATTFASLSVARRMSARHLVVRAVMGEAGTVTVNGNVTVPGASKVFRINPVFATAKPGKTVTLRPALSKPALRSIRKALRRHRRVRLKLTLTARDVAGNIAVQKRTARLRR